MYVVNACFHYDFCEIDPAPLFSELIDAWRNNGQLIGREISWLHEPSHEGGTFRFALSAPMQDSLLPQFNSSEAEALIEALAENGVAFAGVEVLGRNYNAVETAPAEAKPKWQMLFTTFLDTCSPLYDAEHFAPRPLFWLNAPELSQAIIKWQEDWQACDQLQMNGNLLEAEALAQISEAQSALSQRGRALCAQVEQVSGCPTYYYLYQLKAETALQHCPNCHKPWRLADPLDFIAYKCDECRLVSNEAWEEA